MKQTLVVATAALALAGISLSQAHERDEPKSGFGRLDHVFLIIMENEAASDVLGNPNAPFINHYASIVNNATNYFAVGHPSAPNYLELVGGSNFGVSDDYWPNWIDGGCIDNAPSSTGCNNAVTPIAVPGMDNPVVATATDPSQCNGQIDVNPPVPDNCALYDYPSAPFTPKSIAHQLVAKNKSWKTYQESLPTVQPGVAGVNYSDGAFSNLSPVSVFNTAGAIQKLYAVKHNPFVYFQNIELGTQEGLTLQQVQDFDGPSGLWADLQTNDVPNLSVIVPNQCHDMHGYVSGGTAICSSKSDADNALLIQQGDAAVAKLVNGIKASPVWKQGRNAIVLVYDENDYENAANKVVMLVETSYAKNGNQSATPYDHYSLLRTLEAAFGLPCLNHACDSTSKVMDDMFRG